jgi:hypothetical protein
MPRGVNIERLRDPDANWSQQFLDLGLDALIHINTKRASPQTILNPPRLVGL